MTHATWRPGRVALLLNDASGSYSPAAAEALQADLARHDLAPVRIYAVPGEAAPDAAALEAEGIDTLAIFAGDGTISRTVNGLGTWNGAVLPLPGGTMNLLCARLHGEGVEAGDIVAHCAAGQARAQYRPAIGFGDRRSLVGTSCGPGVEWYHVREAMREVGGGSGSVGELAGTTRQAFDATLNGPMVVCRQPDAGRPEGYSLIELEPEEQGIRVIAYTAQDFGGYVKQGMAMLLRRFREGPHEDLGVARQVVLADGEDTPLLLSFDGEPDEGQAEARFTAERSPVALVGTRDD